MLLFATPRYPVPGVPTAVLCQLEGNGCHVVGIHVCGKRRIRSLSACVTTCLQDRPRSRRPLSDHRVEPNDDRAGRTRRVGGSMVESRRGYGKYVTIVPNYPLLPTFTHLRVSVGNTMYPLLPSECQYG